MRSSTNIGGDSTDMSTEEDLDGFPNWIAIPLGFVVVAVIVVVALLDKLSLKLRHISKGGKP